MMMRNDRILFPEGKEKAVTFSFDDGVTQDKRLIQLFDRYQVKGTFNLNSGNLGQSDMIDGFPFPVSHKKLAPEELSEVYKGYEIALHGYKHIDLSAVPSNVQMYELTRDKYELEKNVDYPINGMAYAFGQYTNETKKILQLLKIDYARTVVSTHAFAIPNDFLEWNPTCHFNDDNIFQLIDRFFFGKPLWGPETRVMYIWGHSYELDGLNKWEQMENILEKISGNPKVWYASNGDIARYVKAYQNLQYNMTGNIIYNGSNIELWTEIDKKIYHIGIEEKITVSRSETIANQKNGKILFK